jgi:glycosyltransferase involved in cell wall biosynthesis
VSATVLGRLREPALARASEAASRLRVLFLVRGLNVGGAQRQLVVLARGLRRKGHAIAVAVFYGGGAFEEELRAEGISVHDLAKRGRWDTVGPLARLARLVRSQPPEILHAYMSLANLFSAAAKPLFPPGVKVVWGIRTAMHDLSRYGWLSRLGPLLGGVTSSLADAVVANSHAALRQAVASGIDERKIVVVPNGIDCDRFRPDPEGRARLRREWRIPEKVVLVGVVARLDPVKNHAAFLRAASLVAAWGRRDVHFVCVGGGEDGYRGELERLASKLALGGRVTWAGEQQVTSAVHSALDVAVLPSDAGESFPNVVAEAMACGVPCVVTDSGDAPRIVGGTGVVAPPGDPVALAQRMIEVLGWTVEARAARSARARARIAEEYSLEKLVARSEETLQRVRHAP